MSARRAASVTRIICSVKVDDGSFDSEIAFPIAASEAERRAALDLWSAMLQRALTVIPVEEATP